MSESTDDPHSLLGAKWGRLARNTFYSIKLINFDKHQQNLKKGHKSILISTSFLSDPKVRVLSPVTKLLFLSCLLVAGESTSSHIEVSHDSLCFQSGVKSGSLQSQLDLLQSLRLLTYEKEVVLYNRIEKKVIEKKRKEIPDRSILITQKDENLKIKEAYFNAYRLRYGIDPVQNCTFNSQVSNLRKKLGTEDSIKVVEFYLTHNESFYLKNTHSFGLCLSGADTLRTQMLRGQQITSAHVKQLEKSLEHQTVAVDNSRRIDEMYKEKQKQLSGGINES